MLPYKPAVPSILFRNFDTALESADIEKCHHRPTAEVCFYNDVPDAISYIEGDPSKVCVVVPANMLDQRSGETQAPPPGES